MTTRTVIITCALFALTHSLCAANPRKAANAPAQDTFKSMDWDSWVVSYVDDLNSKFINASTKLKYHNGPPPTRYEAAVTLNRIVKRLDERQEGKDTPPVTLEDRQKIQRLTDELAGVLKDIGATVKPMELVITDSPYKDQSRWLNEMPRDSWSFAMLDSLAIRLSIPSLPNLVPREDYRNYLSPYDMATQLARILDRVKTIDAGKLNSPAPILMSQDKNVVKGLVAEFKPILDAVGYFQKEAAWKKQDNAPEFNANDMFRDSVTLDTWYGFVIHDFSLRTRGSGLFFISLFGRSRRTSRYEAIVAIHRAMREASKRNIHTPTITKEDLELVNRLYGEFKNDFATIGITSVDYLVFTQFPDVPKTHWAYNAVAELKRKGVLVGYPDPIDNTFLPKQSASR